MGEEFAQELLGTFFPGVGKQRLGFALDRQEGSHVTLVRDRLYITVPCHGGKDLKPGTLRNIIRQAGLTVAEFSELLRRA